MDEFIEFVKQWDARYRDPEAERLLRWFIDEGAITIHHLEYTFSNTPDLKGIKGPQKDLKRYTLHIFEAHNIEFRGFEKHVQHGVVDVLGDLQSRQIFVECGPCRVDKAMKYLQTNDAELWLVNDTFSMVSTRKVHLHILRRGPKWDLLSSRLTDQKLRNLHATRSPLDAL